MTLTIANSIIAGDCNDVLRTLPDASVDLVLTDPPYGVRYRDAQGRTIANDDDLGPVLSAFPALYRVLKPDSFCVSFYGWNRIDQFFAAWIGAGFRPVAHLVWRKDYASRVGYAAAHHEQAYVLAKGRPPRPAKPIPDVLPWEYSGNRVHPTEKAVSVLMPVIRAYSAPDDLVLDPFSGSGSTSVAAALAGRRYLGIEIDPAYCETASRRLTGVHRYRERTV